MIIDWFHSGHNQSDTHSGCVWLIIEPHGGQRPGPVNEGLLTACKSALVEASKLAASEMKELTFVPSSESRSERDRRGQLVQVSLQQDGVLGI